MLQHQNLERENLPIKAHALIDLIEINAGIARLVLKIQIMLMFILTVVAKLRD